MIGTAWAKGPPCDEQSGLRIRKRAKSAWVAVEDLDVQSFLAKAESYVPLQNSGTTRPKMSLLVFPSTMTQGLEPHFLCTTCGTIPPTRSQCAKDRRKRVLISSCKRCSKFTGLSLELPTAGRRIAVANSTPRLVPFLPLDTSVVACYCLLQPSFTPSESCRTATKDEASRTPRESSERSTPCRFVGANENSGDTLDS